MKTRMKKSIATKRNKMKLTEKILQAIGEGEKVGNLEGNFGGYFKDTAYYTVIKPFEVFLVSGHKPSNANYGSANLLEPVWQKVKLRKGDQIQMLAGGAVFAVLKSALGGFAANTWTAVAMNQPKFSPFQRGDDKNLTFPLDSLKREETEKAALKGKPKKD
jgi:hypothetical protein